ncbi:hypothetical protein CVV68_19405 [Arthrobacter livingstonensis]|uniref:DUF1211 domain-containing protein n=1 Tax=Arthrobacter livingstonensis TaxID=670078 RepID=A0A2V5L1Q8_9MICC|nr:TMEM175 family protein [Arthrobacter livingstonensis]PYI65095.1 hypothetical protein CVV68_19405 [Arthrobacter livingstonensis]
MQHGPKTDRTVFFSDAVFAIAMTLLALDLKIPTLPSDISEQGYNEVLVERLPSLAAFVLSFVLVGRAWLTHHHHFNAIAAYDNKLQVRNLVMLFLVVFLPVPRPCCSNPGRTRRGRRPSMHWRLPGLISACAGRGSTRTGPG